MFEALKPKSPQELWNKYRAEFLKIYASEQGLKIAHKDLEKWFIDSNGKQYYKFPKSMSLPIERKGHLTDLYTHLSSGISGEEMDKLLSAMDNILSQGVGKPEVASKLGAIIHILKERRKLIFHTEILYNILAVQAIREDEAPDTYSTEIQLQKVAQFKEEVSKSNSYFFFQQTRLHTPIDLLSLTPEEWASLWEESQVQQGAMEKMLDLVLTSGESKKKGQTSTSS